MTNQNIIQHAAKTYFQGDLELYRPRVGKNEVLKSMRWTSILDTEIWENPMQILWEEGNNNDANIT